MEINPLELNHANEILGYVEVPSACTSETIDDLRLWILTL